jgi:membrane associated rhomboid family serine protease
MERITIEGERSVGQKTETGSPGSRLIPVCARAVCMGPVRAYNSDTSFKRSSDVFLLPIGDEPNLPGRPVITYLLIALNVAVFVLISLPLTVQAVDTGDPALLEYLRAFGVSGFHAREVVANMSAYDLFMFKHGFKPADPSWVDLVASMFLHGGWLHLAGNMLFLWIYGDNVELHVGRLGYVALYLLTGVSAVALHAVFRLDSMVPMVGASGAISGILGAYFLWFPRNSVRVLFVVFFFVQIIRAPARLVLGIYLVVENLLPFLLSESATGVAYGAHIGGFLGGLGGAAAVTYLNRRRALEGSARVYTAQRRAGQVQSGTSGDAFREAVEQGNWPTALSLFTEMPMAERLSLPDVPVLALADWLVQSEQLPAALAVLQRFIATHPRSPLLGRAHLRAGLIHLRERRLPAAYQHFLAVLDLDAGADEIEGARAGLAEVERRQHEARRLRFN